MILPYTWRLLCLCCASFFMIHLGLALLARLASGTAIRMSERMKASSAARLLFLLRVTPPALALLAVLAFCIPSYLWLEPKVQGERVGMLCVLAAVLGVAVWILSLTRATSAVRGTVKYLHACERKGRPISMPGETSPALLLSGKAPVLAMAGVLQPRLVISKRVMHGLSKDQIDAALRHEQAHRTSRDNLKRFLLLLAPDVLPVTRSFASVERSWSKFTEWAADDQAAEGDPSRALSLAAALVGVARMGSRPRLAPLASALVSDDRDLQQRVDRLLRPQANPGKPAEVLFPFLGGAGAVLAGCVLTVVLWHGSLTAVHQLLERLVH